MSVLDEQSRILEHLPDVRKHAAAEAKTVPVDETALRTRDDPAEADPAEEKDRRRERHPMNHDRLASRPRF